jgi:hypothetical protein
MGCGVIYIVKKMQGKYEVFIIMYKLLHYIYVVCKTAIKFIKLFYENFCIK